MNYLCLKTQEFFLPPYSIFPLKKEEMEKIKEWRNAQLSILRQKKPLTNEDQENYWKQVIFPSFKLKKPEQLLFAFRYADILIGYGGLTYIDWEAKRAEVSFLVDPTRTFVEEDYKKDFSAFLLLLKQLAFKELGLHSLFTETYSVRPFHIAVLEESGFILEGRLQEHVKIEGKYYDSLFHRLQNTL